MHRLVALAFIPNPNNYPIINHKDENPSNNYINNLEWCTQKYNCNYGTHNKKVSNTLKGRVLSEETKLKISKSNKGKKHTEKTKLKISKSNMKKIICLNTNEIFESMKMASEKYNTCSSHISNCCKGKRKTAGKLEDGTKLQWMYY